MRDSFVFHSVIMLAVMSAKHLAAEVPREVAPDGVNVVGIVLDVGHLDEEIDVFEEIMDHDIGDFQEPIPHFLEPASGILVVRYIALRPSFRHIGLGREVMRELVRAMADPRIGLVLLDTRPLQHRPHGYDDFDDEVRDLPWNSSDEDRTT